MKKLGEVNFCLLFIIPFITVLFIIWFPENDDFIWRIGASLESTIYCTEYWRKFIFGENMDVIEKEGNRK